MLAQNFKTAADLGIEDAEFEALIKVLGMLERRELRAHPVDPEKQFKEGAVPLFADGFNMGPYLEEGSCGTVGCIAGWAHLVSGRTVFPFVSDGDGCDGPDGLFDLFHCDEVHWKDRYSITLDQAATALRSYLSTGDANWTEALA